MVFVWFGMVLTLSWYGFDVCWYRVGMVLAWFRYGVRMVLWYGLVWFGMMSVWWVWFDMVLALI